MPPPSGWENPYSSDLITIWQWIIITQYILMGIPILGFVASFLIGLGMNFVNVIMVIQDWKATFDPYLTGD